MANSDKIIYSISSERPSSPECIDLADSSSSDDDDFENAADEIRELSSDDDSNWDSFTVQHSNRSKNESDDEDCESVNKELLTVLKDLEEINSKMENFGFGATEVNDHSNYWHKDVIVNNNNDLQNTVISELTMPDNGEPENAKTDDGEMTNQETEIDVFGIDAANSQISLYKMDSVEKCASCVSDGSVSEISINNDDHDDSYYGDDGGNDFIIVSNSPIILELDSDHEENDSIRILNTFSLADNSDKIVNRHVENVINVCTPAHKIVYDLNLDGIKNEGDVCNNVSSDSSAHSNKNKTESHFSDINTGLFASSLNLSIDNSQNSFYMESETVKSLHEENSNENHLEEIECMDTSDCDDSIAPKNRSCCCHSFNEDNNTSDTEVAGAVGGVSGTMLKSCFSEATKVSNFTPRNSSKASQGILMKITYTSKTLQNNRTPVFGRMKPATVVCSSEKLFKKSGDNELHIILLGNEANGNINSVEFILPRKTRRRKRASEMQRKIWRDRRLPILQKYVSTRQRSKIRLRKTAMSLVHKARSFLSQRIIHCENQVEVARPSKIEKYTSQPLSRLQSSMPHTINPIIWTNVFRLLSREDVENALFVCKAWYGFGMGLALWNHMDLSAEKLNYPTMLGILRRTPIHLNLTCCTFTSEDLSNLLHHKRLKNLKSLCLAGSHVKYLDVLKSYKCPELQSLDLGFVEYLDNDYLRQIFSKPDDLPYPTMTCWRTTSLLTNLKILSLSGTQITDPAMIAIADFGKCLENLDMSNCGRLTNRALKFLRLPHSKLTKTLLTLNLSGCSLLTKACLEQFLEFKALTTLDIRRTNIPIKDAKEKLLVVIKKDKRSKIVGRDISGSSSNKLQLLCDSADTEHELAEVVEAFPENSKAVPSKVAPAKENKRKRIPQVTSPIRKSKRLKNR